MPRFSVLLPTHQRPDVVGAAIGSVLAQTEPDFELLVVCDGCLDETVETVEAFGDSRIRIFDLPKAPGFGYANRNKALCEATGELVAFMAHDDLLLPDHLELMAKNFEPPKRMWAYSRPLWIDDAGRVYPFYVNLTTALARRDFMTRRNVLPATCVVHRRSCFDLVGMWPEDSREAGDWDLWKRIIHATGPAHIGFVRRPTTLHFRANWRDVNKWGPPPLAYLSGMAALRAKWLDRLTLSPDEASEQPLQHQILALMQANPAQFSMRLRAGVDELQDEMAWEAGIDRLYHGG